MEVPSRFWSLWVLLWMASSAPASGAAIGFASAPSDPFTDYVELGVTFSAPGSLLRVARAPSGSPALVSAGPTRPWFRAHFADPAASVAVSLGDYGFDQDLLFLEAFDAGRNLLATSELFIGTEDALMHQLSVAVDGIAYVLFGSRTPGSSGNSVYADDFTFEPITPGIGPEPNDVPEPGTTVMLISSLALLVLLRHGRRRPVA